MARITGSVAALFIITTLLVGCAGSSRHVKGEDAGSGNDLSGKWSPKDAKQTSEVLMKQMLGGGWLPSFTDEEDRKPRIRVRDIVNKTREHIEAQIFIKNIERELINSGKVSVLAQEGGEQEAVRRAQDDAISGRIDEGAEVGNELGEDFVVTVLMTMILDQVEGKQRRFYKINMELQHATTSEKVWIGDHEVQKRVKQDKHRW